MNRSRIVLGLATILGLGVAAACGSSSSGNGAAGNGNDSGSSSGASTSSSGGGSSGGTSCASGQSLCIGILGTSCVDAGATCLGTNVVASECSATNACPGTQVCCSSYVGSDGGIILYDDAGATAGGLTAFNVAVQCMSQCPSNAASSKVCVLEADGGSPTACPDGTICSTLLPAAYASTEVPNTLCLAPRATFDGGAFPPFDAGKATGNDASSSSGTDAATSEADAASE